MKKVQDLEVSEKILTGASSSEPQVTFEDEHQYKSKMWQALNWYNATWDEKQYYKHSHAFVKKYYKEYLQFIDDAQFHEIRQIAVLGRIIMNGGSISDKDNSKILSGLKFIKQKYTKKQKKRVVKVIEPCQHLSFLDGIVDDIIGGVVKNFDIANYYTENNCQKDVTTKVAVYFKPVLDEISSNDPDIKECYEYIPTKILNKLKTILESFVNFKSDVADTVQDIVKKPRKERVKKPKTADKLVSKLKFLKEFDKLKLKSVNPKQIVGSTECYLYNTDTRKLTKLVANDSTGLTVKGSTIINFDERSSETKTIRKPEEFFKTLSFGKRAMKAAWNDLKTKSSLSSGRVSDKTIILCVN